ncbi:hypothetical protein [Andreprevotia lacus]|uniref:hypothetical protein n=1 Tax=Andreprevotia lacus TaxID=1121000 RepID=UPI00111BF007|nr:hypothetical protein [Andreprevotia lacus]
MKWAGTAWQGLGTLADFDAEIILKTGVARHLFQGVGVPISCLSIFQVDVKNASFEHTRDAASRWWLAPDTEWHLYGADR